MVLEESSMSALEIYSEDKIFSCFEETYRVSIVNKDSLGTAPDFLRMSYFSHAIAKLLEKQSFSVLDFKLDDSKIVVTLNVCSGDEEKLSAVLTDLNVIAAGLNVQMEVQALSGRKLLNGQFAYDITDFEQSASACSDPEARFRKVDLVEALRSSQFVVHCQPLVNIDTKSTKGVEFLIRWNHPEKGLLLPYLFLPEIEQYGLQIDLDMQVLHEAESQLFRWQNLDRFSELSISVNLYYETLVSTRLLNWLSSFKARQPLLFSKLVLEITETGHIENGGLAHNNMKLIQSMGYFVSIDDFGSGTSICSYLTYLNPNQIKIDRSLIATAFDFKNDKSSIALKMLESMIDWFAAMEGVELVIEGIESPSQHEYLKALGATVGQGYEYSKPVPLETFMESR